MLAVGITNVLRCRQLSGFSCAEVAEFWPMYEALAFDAEV